MTLSTRPPAPGARKAFLVYNTASYLLRFRSDLIEALRAEGYLPCAVVPRSDPACVQLEARGVRCIDLPISGQRITPGRDLAMLYYLYRLYRTERPDLVLNFTIKPAIYSSIAARLAGVPTTVTMITGLGYVFTDGTWTRRAIRAVVETQYRIALSGNRVVFFQNPDDRTLFVDAGLVARARAVLVDGSGVDLRAYRPAERTGPDGGPTVVMIARLIRDKGVREFVEAARVVRRQRPDARFVLVGPRDANPAAVSDDELEGWVAEGVIRYEGEVEDVRPLLAGASAFVLPSYREGTPRTSLEAMAMGLPVITTDVPGCRETVVDGENGFLVPARDPAALAEAMLRLLGDPARAAQMGRMSRAIAERRYDVAKVTRTILSHLVATPRA